MDAVPHTRVSQWVGANDLWAPTVSYQKLTQGKALEKLGGRSWGFWTPLPKVQHAIRHLRHRSCLQ